MSDYVRPTISVPEFTDVSGHAIPYGNRWGGGKPHVESYSVEANLERFAPLHTVADALIDYLVREFHAAKSDDLFHAGDLLETREDVARAVRVTPKRPDAAPLTFVFTTYPGVVIHAGELHDFAYPDCGCDACDETAESQADHMETLVLAVAGGRYQETPAAGFTRWIGYEFSSTDGGETQSGRSGVASIPRVRLKAATARLQSLRGGWQPWAS